MAGTAAAATPRWRSRNAIALEAIEHPLVRKGLDVWNAARGNRRWPAKPDMGPRAMLGLHSNTALIRVLGDGEFEFRIVGDQIAIQQGAPVQGKRMAEIDQMLPGYGALLKRIFCAVIEAGEPLAFRGWYQRAADKHPFRHEAVVLPVGDDGNTIDHIFVVAA
jgi:hypothetical protein